MPATLTDVARRASVSLATASRAFSDPDRLAAATRERVMAAAVELGYQAAPSTATRNIGVVVPDVANPVFGSMLKAIHDRAWQGGHQVVLVSTDEDPRRERQAVERLSGSTDGMILVSPRAGADTMATTVANSPSVLVNEEVDGAHSVLLDASGGIAQAVEHLHALGHRRIAYVPGPSGSWADGNRRHAVAANCDNWGVELVVVGSQAASVSGGRAAAASVVAGPATAVITFNDLVAVGVRSGAAALGRHCPESLSVIGVDDLEITAQSEPAMTSVHVSVTRAGMLAVEQLMSLIEGRIPADRVVRLGSQLMVRDSTAPPPRTSNR